MLKYDIVFVEINFMKIKIDMYGEIIVVMKFVVDGVCGLVWKVVVGVLMGGIGVVVVIVVVFGKGVWW